MIIVLSGVDIEAIGGMEVHCRYLLRFLSQNYDAHLIIKRIEGCLIKNLRKDDVKFFDNANECIKKMAGSPVKVVFLNDGHWLEELPAIRDYFPRAMMIMRSGGNEFMKAKYHDMSIPLENRQKAWANIINEHLDFIIANSTYSWYRMRSIGIKTEKCIIIKGGVDLNYCRYNYDRRSTLRREFDNKFGTHGKYLFCIAARLVPFKGIADIIHAFRVLLLKRYNNWHLLIIGDGVEAIPLYQMATNELQEGYYTFTGAVAHERCMDYIALSDCLLNASGKLLMSSENGDYIHTETMGRSILEAICQGVPVLARAVGGVPEWEKQFPCAISLVKDKRYWEKFLSLQMKNKTEIQKVDNEMILKMGWDYIFEQLYRKLWEGSCYEVRTMLCFDLDGTVVHDFCTSKENSDILYKLINMASEEVAVVINSAGDYEEVLEHYPILSNYLDRIILVTNCGQKIYVRGEIDEFWLNYHALLSSITDKEIEQVKYILEENQYEILRIQKIDKLYINFKIGTHARPIIEILELINRYLSDTSHMAVANSNNVKIISQIINKGASIRYLRNHRLKYKRSIGIGNNILDKLFVKECDYQHYVNFDDPCAESIHNYQELLSFIYTLRKEVYSET